jgi:thiol reductant ABC exporter CydD subunit
VQCASSLARAALRRSFDHRTAPADDERSGAQRSGRARRVVAAGSSRWRAAARGLIGVGTCQPSGHWGSLLSVAAAERRPFETFDPPTRTSPGQEQARRGGFFSHDRGMRAIDPRLIRYARATRSYLAVSTVLGVVLALLIIAQAWLLARAVSGAFVGGRDVASLRTTVVALLGVVVARAAVVWSGEVIAQRSSARAKSQLRIALLERVARLDSTGSVAGGTGDLVTLATRGVDALDEYFARYLPQLLLAVIVPAAVLVVVASSDWVAAAIIAITLPLIPLFMALVGATTRGRTDRQLQSLQRLSGHFLDVVAGLPTLKIFGRAKAQAQAVRDMTDRYRRTTMATLRLAFLSSLVLELLATISVALVAVAVGLRLLSGHVDFRTALFVLVLAPEAYLPLRLLGANFHASAEGMSAAAQVFEVLEKPERPRGTMKQVPDPAVTGLRVEGLRVVYRGRSEPALRGVSLTVEPGELVAVTGPSGCGKSTLLGVLLGFVLPDSGSVRVGDVDLSELDPDAWRAQLAWVPQRPHLFATSIADNLRLGRPSAPPADLDRAVADAGLDGVVAKLPRGLDTRLGERGAGLSVGERQRVALARAFLRDAPLLLLDEPTANLDGDTEAEVLAVVRRLAQGRTVVLVAHRPALAAMADRVVSFERASVAS